MTTGPVEFMFFDRTEDSSSFWHLDVRARLGLAATLWVVSTGGWTWQAKPVVFKAATSHIAAVYPERAFWLLACHDCRQHDNRISRYYRLWKLWEKAGRALPAGDYEDEILQEYHDGIRYFSAVRFPLEEIDKVIDLVRDHRQSFIVSLDPGQGEAVRRVLDAGWTKACGPAENALEEITAAGGIVLNVYGEFDDPEVAVAAIGNPADLGRLRGVTAAG